jgi:hypothetical protein
LKHLDKELITQEEEKFVVFSNIFQLQLGLDYNWEMLSVTRFVLMASSALCITAFPVNVRSSVQLILAILERYHAPCVFVIHDGKQGR